MTPAVRRAPSEHSPRVEDYLEVVFHLIAEKGYATTSDISERLKVKPPTVSIMVAKLADKGYLQHERYKGMRLTARGSKLAKSVIERHAVIAEFLAMIGVDEATAYEDTEGIEHHVQEATFSRLQKTADYFRKNPKALRSLRRFIDTG